MVDRPDRSPQPFSGPQRQPPPPPPPPQHHHQQLHSHRQQTHPHQPQQHHYPASQTQRAYHHHNQDIQGPLSAGVIEGHRAFPSFHASLPHRQRQVPVSTSYPNLSVADILDRYQDANKDFLMSILNAKAKEDERKAEEERYKTEQIKLQSKQVELEMALEKRRGSSPAGRSHVQGASESNNTHYSAPTSTPYRPGAYPPYSSPAASSLPPDASPEQYPRQAQHDHPHGSKDSTDSPSGKHAPGRHGSSQHPYQDQGQMQPSPQGRPPFLKINTSVRQGYGNQQGPNSSSSQRVSPQHAGPYPQLPQGGSSSTKGPGRPYTFPALSSNSAQSSPVTNVDYQSYIPPPLTPKDDHVSPTSSHAPQQGHNLKRKSIHHDAVMDAVRAKVLRNAAGQGHQQREQLHKKTSLDSMGRRRAQLQSSSPERLRKAADNTSNGSPTGGAVAGSQSKSSPSSQHNSEGGPSNAQFPSTTSPTSPSTPSSANAGSIRSRSSSPPSATAASEAPLPTRLGRRESHSGYSRVPIREDSRDDPNGSEDERAPSRYVMDRARTDRSSEIGALAT